MHTHLISFTFLYMEMASISAWYGPVLGINEDSGHHELVVFKTQIMFVAEARTCLENKGGIVEREKG